MKYLQTLVSSIGFREITHNDVRWQALTDLLKVAKDQSAELVVLPGGYFTATDESELRRIVLDAASLALESETTLALGVDLHADAKSKGQTIAKLPYYGAVCGQVSSDPWKQTSDTNANAEEVADDDVPGKGRVVEIAGKRVGVLLCGELFSERARRSFGELNLQLSVDLGHVGMGQGLIPAMKSLVNYGSGTVVHSQHVASYGRSLHLVGADGIQRSVPAADCEFIGDDEFWITWLSRNV